MKISHVINEGVTNTIVEAIESKGPWLNNKTNKWVAWYKKDSRSDPITISADSEEEVQSQLNIALDKIQSQRLAKTAIAPGQNYDFGLSSMVLRDLVGMEKGAPIYLKLGPDRTIDVSTQGGPGFVKGKITKSPAGYGHLFRVSGNDVVNSGMAGSTRYDVKKIASNGTLTRLQITGEGRPYYSTHDLEAGGLDHKPSAVIRVPGRNIQGMEEGEGNFVGDFPQPNIGGATVKPMQVGDTVSYFGQTAKLQAQSPDRKHSRIAITKGTGGVVQTVLTSDLKRVHRGMAEEIRPTTGQAMGIRNQIAQKMNPDNNKFIWKRPNQIMGSHTENELRALKFRYSAKYNSWGGTQQMWGSLEGTLKEFAPTKPPTAGAFGGNKDYGQPTSSRYIGGNKFVLGTSNNYVLTATVDKWGLEWDEDDNIWFLDSPGAAHIADATEGEIELPAPQEQRNQIHDLVTDYLNDHNSAELQRVAAYYGHSADGEMATSEGIRVPAQQILGTKNRAKSAYYPTNVKPKVPKLDTPLTDKELTRLSQLAGINPNK